MALVRRVVPLAVKSFKLLPITTQSHKIHRYVAPTLMAFKKKELKAGGKKENPRNTFLEWNLEAEIFAFSKRLGEDFDADLLLQAFTDRTYVIKEELKQKEIDFALKMKDNRELAEEGEKFLKEYIQAYLEHVLPKFPLEGVAGVRHHLTCEETLAHISLNLGTKDMILAAQYPVENYTLATCFKAIVGALIKSSGEEKAAHFVRDFVITMLHGKDVNEYWHIEDPWTMLNELVKKDGAEIEPRLIGETARNTLLACYRVGLYVDKRMISSGYGETVATAKEMASREALKKIFGTQDHMPPINYKVDGMPKASAQERYQIASS